MLRSKIISPFILLALSSCVKIYTPKIKSSDLNKYVVSGQIKTDQQTQTVNVSQSASIESPTYKPLTGCSVSISDNENHRFIMKDMGNGDYTTMIDPEYLVPGHVFRVEVVTPGGDSLVSDFDTLQQDPPVDSVYYIRKDFESSGAIRSSQGIQFYINLKGTKADSRYYKWDIYETWQYHAEYPVEFYYDGKIIHRIYPPDSSEYTCWDTRRIPEVFTLTTENLSQNTYDGLPLQYVGNRTQKLANGYSMLVKQLALSKEAYDYWDKLQTTSTQLGGLYEREPVSIKGNVHDITNPGKEVLGFFDVASVSSKRIFVGRIQGLPMNYVIPCMAVSLKRGLIMIPPSAYPAVLMASTKFPYFPATPLVWLTPICVNCMIQGGDTIKPSFWPN